MNRRLRYIVIFLLLSAGMAIAAIEPAPTTYVEDRAKILDGTTRTRLIGLLQELEQKTDARIVVLTVDTTSGQPISDYSFERADKWKFGANQQSASVLVVVAVKDREYWMQVGYNWEHVLTDSVVGTIGRQYFVPAFKAGDYAQGLWLGTATLAKIVAQSKGVTLSGMPNLPRSQKGLNPGATPCNCCGLIVIFVILWIFLKAVGQHPSLIFWALLMNMLSSGRGGSWGSGSSSGGFGGGGGGFGSFGGGGGGGFGGGGAGGKW